ncbi:hypothetical protein COCON_G00090640 [Conger conger]|uniref:Uncharacterized protein n=1 Tax=Conger conger TaxID=82655 RepID=A0A9Q1DLA5_CONCO|nr:hypothetical protein COCON_G00090640 [Conger conger]
MSKDLERLSAAAADSRLGARLFSPVLRRAGSVTVLAAPGGPRDLTTGSLGNCWSRVRSTAAGGSVDDTLAFRTAGGFLQRRIEMD